MGKGKKENNPLSSKKDLTGIIFKHMGKLRKFPLLY